MPLPLILGAAAAIAGAAGIGTGIHGAVKMKDAKDKYNRNIARFEEKNKVTTNTMDELGKAELGILASFEKFTELMEKVHNRPEFEKYHKQGISMPQYNAEEIKRASIGAGLLLGGIGGAAVGTAGGFAAAGATTAAVMALGTASTGTAIASLSGAAATNAALAALGGGTIMAGGGGMALGTTILGATTLGVGLLVGGVIFSITGSKLSDKAEEAWEQAKKVEKEIDVICKYLEELNETAVYFNKKLEKVNTVYKEHLYRFNLIVNVEGRTNWESFTLEEQQMIENTALLVQLLYNMCKVQLVLQSNSTTKTNTVNSMGVKKVIAETQVVLAEKQINIKL